MRYNINKKKNKFNLISLYKYKHYILVLIITIWFFWYIKYFSKIKEGIFGGNFGSNVRKLFDKKRNKKIKELNKYSNHYNYYNYLACYYRERPDHNRIKQCKDDYDVKVDYNKLKLTENTTT
tara:strand:- start:361 stop:726 length:366 start_codon:yes stop_codon:yes gene_type:complete